MNESAHQTKLSIPEDLQKVIREIVFMDFPTNTVNTNALKAPLMSILIARKFTNCNLNVLFHSKIVSIVVLILRMKSEF